MANQRRGGLIQIKVNGAIMDAKGDFTVNLGGPKREAIIGVDGIHGFKETIQVPFIEGAVTLAADTDIDTLINLEDATIVSEESNGRTVVLQGAWYAGEGSWTTGEGELPVRFEGLQARKV